MIEGDGDADDPARCCSQLSVRALTSSLSESYKLARGCMLCTCSTELVEQNGSFDAARAARLHHKVAFHFASISVFQSSAVPDAARNEVLASTPGAKVTAELLDSAHTGMTHLMPKVFEALYSECSAMEECNAVAETVHAEGLGEDSQRLPHVRHVGHIWGLPRLQGLTPRLQHLINKVCHTASDLRKGATPSCPARLRCRGNSYCDCCCH